LLCSLTSASEVSYSEQWDMEYMGKKISAGKFKSMLLDIFGYCYPENEFFTVDREAVASYKAHVDKKIVELREDILSLL
jgi:hypothetical protein